MRGEHWQPMLTYGEAALEEVTFRGEAAAEASRVNEAARRYILILKKEGQKKFIVYVVLVYVRILFYAALVIVFNTCLGCLVSNEVINNQEQSRLLYLVSDI